MGCEGRSAWGGVRGEGRGGEGRNEGRVRGVRYGDWHCVPANAANIQL